ncbi:MAG: hypothetical protein JW889_04760 [Verrucomicrobia bacterium]|nr:hypothetical protein [Verrucomicrobiota bacterium]
MKLVMLIVLGVVILAAAAASYSHYSWWYEHRHDEMIAEAANRHDLDPALVKALIDVLPRMPQTDNEDRLGLMLVTQGVLESYRAAHGITAWGYICSHRRFPNHDLNKREQYTSALERQTCQAPGCGQPLTSEPLDLETNLDIGCWALAEMRELLRASCSNLSPNELDRRMLVFYRDGLPRGSFTMTAEQERFASEVIRRQIEHRPTFERLVRRRTAR